MRAAGVVECRVADPGKYETAERLEMGWRRLRVREFKGTLKLSIWAGYLIM